MDDDGFLALGKKEELGQKDYVILKYYFETYADPKTAAMHLCKEQSTAMWKRVDVDEDFRPVYGAKVVDLNVLGKTNTPGFDTIFTKEKEFTQAEVTIAHPVVNFGARIPNLLTAIAGEGSFYSPGINCIKLMDVEFPKKFLQKFDGPRFGVSGLRKALGIKDRPFIFGVVKPNIGLRPEDFAKLAGEAYLGGLDIAKDDETLADMEYSPLGKRVRLVSKEMEKAEKATGEKKMFVANITDEVDNLANLHDVVLENGGNALMLNALPVGLSACRMLCKKNKIPIVSHFDFIALMSRVPKFGISTKVLTTLQRLAGFDAIIMPGFGERMHTTDLEVLNNVNECLKPLGDIKPCLPVPGGSDWAGSLPNMHNKLKTVDFGTVPGRGIFGHPMGAKAGAKSMRQSWQAIEKGVSLEEHSKNHIELRKALEHFK
ncbi:ribulose 1,5-bisphosphate carboxylase [Candidatus Woesearchaeota archaeon]|nr:ribulose 1,5-bisphosphate carboxylase [Candidatus Woesearchaeota archaeon]